MSVSSFDEMREAGFTDADWQGIFIQRGQLIDISSFTITEHEDGSVTSTSPTLSTSTHMAPFWLSAAVDHCIRAEKLSHIANEAFRSADSEAKSKALNDELIFSMQAITCAAFAVDALHAALLRASPTPEATKIAWRKNRTKRSRQIFETLRRNFSIKPKSAKQIANFLDQLSEARDLAVHPPANSRPTVRHGRLPVSVDPAFNWFRAYNAMGSVGLTFELVVGVARSSSAKDKLVAERMKALLELVHTIDLRWKRTRVGRQFKRLRTESAHKEEG